jgi:hypothetical protein
MSGQKLAEWPLPEWVEFSGFGLALRRGKVKRRDGAECVGAQSVAERATQGQTEAKGSRDERAFWRPEWTDAGGVEGTPVVRGRSRNGCWSRRGKLGGMCRPSQAVFSHGNACADQNQNHRSDENALASEFRRLLFDLFAINRHSRMMVALVASHYESS